MDHLFAVRTIHHSRDGDEAYEYVGADSAGGSGANQPAVHASAAVISVARAHRDGLVRVVVCNLAAASGAFEKAQFCLSMDTLSSGQSHLAFGRAGGMLAIVCGDVVTLVDMAKLLAATPHSHRVEASMMRGFSAPQRQPTSTSLVSPASKPPGQGRRAAEPAGMFGWLLGGSSSTNGPSGQIASGHQWSDLSISVSATVSLGHVTGGDTDINHFDADVPLEVRRLRLPLELSPDVESRWIRDGGSGRLSLGRVTSCALWSPWMLPGTLLLLGHASGHVTLWDATGRAELSPHSASGDARALYWEVLGLDPIKHAKSRTSSLLWWIHLPGCATVSSLQVTECWEDVLLGDACQLAFTEGGSLQAQSELLASSEDKTWRIPLQQVTITPLAQDQAASLTPDILAWEAKQDGVVRIVGFGDFKADHKLCFSHDSSASMQAAFKQPSGEGGLLSSHALRLAGPQEHVLSYASGKDRKLVFATPASTRHGSCWSKRREAVGLRRSLVLFRPASRKVLAYRPGSEQHLELLVELPEPTTLLPTASWSSIDEGGRSQSKAGCTVSRKPPCITDFGVHLLVHERFMWVAWTERWESAAGCQSFVAVLSVSECSRPGTSEAAAHPGSPSSAPSRPSLNSGDHSAAAEDTSTCNHSPLAGLRTPTSKGCDPSQRIPSLVQGYTGGKAVAVFKLPAGESVVSLCRGRAFAEDRVPSLERLGGVRGLHGHGKTVPCLPSAIICTDEGAYEVAPVAITSASHFLAASAGAPALGHHLARALALQQSQVCRFMGHVACCELRHRRQLPPTRARQGTRNAFQSSLPSLAYCEAAALVASALQCFAVSRTPPTEILGFFHRTGFTDEAIALCALCLGATLTCPRLGDAVGAPAYAKYLAFVSQSAPTAPLETHSSFEAEWAYASQSIIPSISAHAKSEVALRMLEVQAWCAPRPDLYTHGTAYGFSPLHLLCSGAKPDVGSGVRSLAAAGEVLLALQLACSMELMPFPLATQEDSRASSMEWVASLRYHHVSTSAAVQMVLQAAISSGQVAQCCSRRVVAFLCCIGQADLLSRPPSDSALVQCGVLLPHVPPAPSLGMRAPPEQGGQAAGTPDLAPWAGERCPAAILVDQSWPVSATLPSTVFDELHMHLRCSELLSLLECSSPSFVACFAPLLAAHVQDPQAAELSDLNRIDSLLLPTAAPQVCTARGAFACHEGGVWHRVQASAQGIDQGPEEGVGVKKVDSKRKNLFDAVVEYALQAQDSLAKNQGLLGVSALRTDALVTLACRCAASIAARDAQAGADISTADVNLRGRLESLTFEGDVCDRVCPELVRRGWLLSASQVWNCCGRSFLASRCCVAAAVRDGVTWDVFVDRLAQLHSDEVALSAGLMTACAFSAQAGWSGTLILRWAQRTGPASTRSAFLAACVACLGKALGGVAPWGARAATEGRLGSEGVSVGLVAVQVPPATMRAAAAALLSWDVQELQSLLVSAEMPRRRMGLSRRLRALVGGSVPENPPAGH